jgi:HrpA-like RNA helicase
MSKIQIRPDGILDPEGKYPNPFTGLPASADFKRLAISPDPAKKGWAQLKAYEDRMIILNKIHSKSILVVVSLPTGTGKTVIVPRLLFHYFGYKQKVIVTTPRHQTTSLAGEFASKCYDVPLFHIDDKGDYLIDPTIEKGKENRYPTGNKFISYKHGKSKEYADNSTLLLFTTDGTVKTLITNGDADLAEYGGIVIDEVHERSVSIDIVIALVMNILTRRKDFKIIFMSATMDVSIFENYFKKLGQGDNFNVYALKEEKTTYDINYIKEDKPVAKNAMKIIDEIYKKIDTTMLDLDKSKEGGDILAFVSSDSETNRLKTKINKNITRYAEDNRPYAVTISGGTKEDEKNIATTKGSLLKLKANKDAPKGYKRKIIIATPAAESSITFGDPLKYVIEGGFAYTIHYDAEKYCYIAGKNYVTQANIKQRCGRTGRTCTGTCIQMYTKKEYDDFPKYSPPEILSEDFTKEILNIMLLPINKQNLYLSLLFIKNMIEPIEHYKAFISTGVKNLKEMDFIDDKFNLTELGHICSSFNVFDIKIAKMVIGGFFFGCIDWVIMLGAIVHVVKSFSDIFKSLNEEEKKDPIKKQKYEDNIKKNIKPEGDHISLLIIYYKYIINNSTYEYANANGLDSSILIKIKDAYQELYDAIKIQNVRTRFAIIDRFVNITTQFKNYPDYAGMSGGTKSKTNTNTNTNTKPRIPRMPPTDTPTRMQKKKFKNISKSISKKTLHKYKQYKKNIKHDHRKIYKENIQNNISNNRTFIKHSKTGRRLINRHVKTSKLQNYPSKYTHYKYTNNQQNRKPVYTSKHTRTQSPIDLDLDIDLNLKGGSTNEQLAKRRMKFMDLLTLSQFNLRNKSIKLPKIANVEDLYTRIIASLYYGFSTNIACYSGVAKDYNVKFSSIQGSCVGGMSKNTFDYIYPTTEPDWLIYNTFTLSQEFGKLEKKGILSLVSKLEPKHLQYFFDIKDIRQQIVAEEN